MTDDPLAAMRGILIAAVIALLFWACFVAWVAYG